MTKRFAAKDKETTTHRIKDSILLEKKLADNFNGDKNHFLNFHYQAKTRRGYKTYGRGLKTALPKIKALHRHKHLRLGLHAIR